MPGTRVLAASAALELATQRGLGAASRCGARRVARALWPSEGCAIVLVMHAVAPPPPGLDDDDDDDDVDPPAAAFTALVTAVTAVVATHESQSAALELLRELLQRSASVRELALRLRCGQDETLLASVVRVGVRQPWAQSGPMPVAAEALAVLCAWLAQCPAACRAALADPDDAACLVALARGEVPVAPAVAKGLSCLALGLALAHFGAGESESGWSREAVQDLVEKRVGRGAFAKALDALKLDAQQAPRRRRDGTARPILDEPDFAEFVQQACTAARKGVVKGLVNSGGGGGVLKTEDLEPSQDDAELAQLRSQLAAALEDKESLNEERDVLEEALRNQAEVIAKDRAEKAQLEARLREVPTQDASSPQKKTHEVSSLEQDARSPSPEGGALERSQMRVAELEQALNARAAGAEGAAGADAGCEEELRARLAALERELQVSKERPAVIIEEDQQLLLERSETVRRLARRAAQLQQTIASLFEESDEQLEEDSEAAAAALLETEDWDPLLEAGARERIAQHEAELRRAQAALPLAARVLRQRFEAELREAASRCEQAEKALQRSELEADGAIDDLATMQDRAFAAENKLSAQDAGANDVEVRAKGVLEF